MIKLQQLWVALLCVIWPSHLYTNAWSTGLRCPLLDVNTHFLGAENKFAQAQVTLRFVTGIIDWI